MISKSTMYKRAGDPIRFSKDSAGKVVELWIERSRWARVQHKANSVQKPHGASKLLNEEGGMCCLGFYARACGVPVTKVFDRSTPASLPTPPDQMKWLIGGPSGGFSQSNSSHAGKLMRVNDQNGQSLLSKEQERKIREVFAENGVKIRFVK